MAGDSGDGDFARLLRAGADPNDQDVAFVRAMIPHHEMAVAMAGEELAKGSDGEVVGLALRIVAAQTEEIAWMRRWLADLGLAEAGGGSHGETP